MVTNNDNTPSCDKMNKGEKNIFNNNRDIAFKEKKTHSHNFYDSFS